MAYSNPVIDVLSKGGSTANQGMQVAATFAKGAYDAILKSGSLALKVDALLAEQEYKKRQLAMQEQKMALAMARSAGRSYGGGGGRRSSGRRGTSKASTAQAQTPEFVAQLNKALQTNQSTAPIQTQQGSGGSEGSNEQQTQATTTPISPSLGSASDSVAQGVAQQTMEVMKQAKPTLTPTERAVVANESGVDLNKLSAPALEPNPLNKEVIKANSQLANVQDLRVQNVFDKKKTKVLKDVSYALKDKVRVLKDNIKIGDEVKTQSAMNDLFKANKEIFTTAQKNPDALLQSFGFQDEQLEALPSNVKTNLVANEVLKQLSTIPTNKYNNTQLSKLIKGWDRVAKDSAPRKDQVATIVDSVMQQTINQGGDISDVRSNLTKTISRLGLGKQQANDAYSILKDREGQYRREQEKTDKWVDKYTKYVTGKEDFMELGDSRTASDRLLKLGERFKKIRPIVGSVLESSGAEGNPIRNMWFNLGDNEANIKSVKDAFKKAVPKKYNYYYKKFKEDIGGNEDDFIKYILEEMPESEYLNLISNRNIKRRR